MKLTKQQFSLTFICYRWNARLRTRLLLLRPTTTKIAAHFNNREKSRSRCGAEHVHWEAAACVTLDSHQTGKRDSTESSILSAIFLQAHNETLTAAGLIKKKKLPVRLAHQHKNDNNNAPT